MNVIDGVPAEPVGTTTGNVLEIWVLDIENLNVDAVEIPIVPVVTL